MIDSSVIPLNECSRRLRGGAEALELGYGLISDRPGDAWKIRVGGVRPLRLDLVQLVVMAKALRWRTWEMEHSTPVAVEVTRSP